MINLDIDMTRSLILFAADGRPSANSRGQALKQEEIIDFVRLAPRRIIETLWLQPAGLCCRVVLRSIR